MSNHWLIAAIGIYTCAAACAWWYRNRSAGSVTPLLFLLVCATTIITIAVVMRWWQVGYGPFLTLYEILLSNVFSLGVIITTAFWFAPSSRQGVRFTLLIILLLGVWALTVPLDPGRLPATFDSPWLWLHVGFGKLFLGALLLALGLALAGLSSGDPSTSQSVSAPAWWFASMAFVFDSAMLLTGAIWAHDAWGRYWNWDPVETWALVTWLTLGLCLHARLAWRVPPRLGWVMIVLVFILAFLTLFGMPFLSLGPHKGVL